MAAVRTIPVFPPGKTSPSDAPGCDGSQPARANAKLFVMWQLLDIRRRRPDAFAGGWRSVLEPLTAISDNPPAVYEAVGAPGGRPA